MILIRGGAEYGRSDDHTTLRRRIPLEEIVGKIGPPMPRIGVSPDAWLSFERPSCIVRSLGR